MNYRNHYQKKALIVVDVQPTFCEGGSLPVAGGNEIARRIATYLKEHIKDYTLFCSTQDWHIAPGTHFSSEPDYVDTWPVHALANKPESDLHPEIENFPFDIKVKKGQWSPAYSGFEGIDEEERKLKDLLEENQIDAIDVVGLALSHCVKETALDALKVRGVKEVRVLLDLTKPVTPEQGEEAIRILRENDILVEKS